MSQEKSTSIYQPVNLQPYMSAVEEARAMDDEVAQKVSDNLRPEAQLVFGCWAIRTVNADVTAHGIASYIRYHGLTPAEYIIGPCVAPAFADRAVANIVRGVGLWLLNTDSPMLAANDTLAAVKD